MMLNKTEQLQVTGHIQTKYIEVLQKDIENNEREQDKLLGEVKSIENLINQLVTFSKRAEWPNSFIPINSLAYMPATIIHPSEFHVKLGTDVYSLMSLQETTDYLHRKVNSIKKILETFMLQHKQLEERYNFYNNTGSESIETIDMPAKIVSNKGSAYKTSAGVYDIMEPYVQEEEDKFYSNRQKTTLQKKSTEYDINEDKALFKRLDELEEQETLLNELSDVSQSNSIESDTELYQRTKIILSESDLYDRLLLDNVIQKHCLAGASEQVKSVLNKLIVNTLKEETDVSFKQIEQEDKAEYLNDDDVDNVDNNRIVIDFLDTVERDM